ncbi:MAG: aldehyde dehydrogenase (NADP(+)) [Chryseolinea sp.]
MTLTGKQIIQGEYTAASKDIFDSLSAGTGKPLGQTFYEATDGEIDLAVEAAFEAFKPFRDKGHRARAAFLRTIASEIELLGDLFLETAANETGLGLDRLKGERMRTMNQLNAFAGFIESGEWVRAIIDRADADRKPIPKPDLRQMQIPLGPAAIFGASNFPFAFSVAGGDTAAALASGCPVVFKGHPAHPATCELAATAILHAIEKTDMPAGAFNLIQGRSTRVGSRLVVHPLIKSVAFTGSFKGGKALYDLAVRRPEPIPVYAEMGSVNPVLVLSSVIKDKREATAKQLAGSITLGSGQFCTNPGVILLIDQPGNNEFLEKIGAELDAITPATMLTKSIGEAYISGVQRQRQIPGTKSLTIEGAEGIVSNMVRISAADAMRHPDILEEVFGPSSVAVVSGDMNELVAFCKTLSGQLTATILGEPEEIENASEVVDVLREKAGRLIVNGYPTGVEVSPAMVHGGPYPATTDSRSTSVGATAIYRFTRPICYQNFPTALLPVELRD